LSSNYTFNFFLSLYEKIKVNNNIANNDIPVARCEATNNGCNFEVTMTIPKIICIMIMTAAISAVLLIDLA
jgi:hypothetical protein